MTHQILILNKPSGPTSHDMVSQLRKVFHTTAVGHAGTLDPLASGVLVMGIGKATKMLSYFHSYDKEYHVKLEFGKISDTYDIQGLIESSRVTLPDYDEIHHTLGSFQGDIVQKPPIFSAIKVAGKKLYEYARQEKEVDIPLRNIHIFEIEMLQYESPYLELRIVCSSGTYIRSICHDLGQKLGCGAVMTDLVRTRIGPYTLDQAITPEILTPEIEGNWDARNMPLPYICIDENLCHQFLQGKYLPLEKTENLSILIACNSDFQPLLLIEKMLHGWKCKASLL